MAMNWHGARTDWQRALGVMAAGMAACVLAAGVALAKDSKFDRPLQPPKTDKKTEKPADEQSPPPAAGGIAVSSGHFQVQIQGNVPLQPGQPGAPAPILILSDETKTSDKGKKASDARPSRYRLEGKLQVTDPNGGKWELEFKPGEARPKIRSLSKASAPAGLGDDVRQQVENAMQGTPAKAGIQTHMSTKVIRKVFQPGPDGKMHEIESSEDSKESGNPTDALKGVLKIEPSTAPAAEKKEDAKK